MRNNLQFANADTPVPSMEWTALSESLRLSRLTEAIAEGAPELGKLLEIAAAKGDGQVVVRLREEMSAGRRGTVLLDLEDFLKKNVDQGLNVWLEGLGDRNSLRNLRGIEVKS